MKKVVVGTPAWIVARIDEREPDECWPWTGPQYGDGYGRAGRHHAHRTAWEFATGETAGALSVLHSCDNPICCNPAHLSLGTHRDNMRQMVERGRSGRGHLYATAEVRGERNPRAKLTEPQVADIRRRYAEGGVRQVDLAREFGVSQPMIGYIVRGEHWVAA